MVDALKDLLETPIERGAEEVRELFDGLFGDLSREERVSIMLFLAVTYVLNENAAMQIEVAASRGKKPGRGAVEKLKGNTMIVFSQAIEAIVQSGVEAAQELRAKKKKGE